MLKTKQIPSLEKKVRYRLRTETETKQMQFSHWEHKIILCLERYGSEGASKREIEGCLGKLCVSAEIFSLWDKQVIEEYTVNQQKQSERSKVQI